DPARVLPSALACPLRPYQLDDGRGRPLARRGVADRRSPHPFDPWKGGSQAAAGRSAVLPRRRFRGSEALNLLAFWPADARAEGAEMLRTVSAVEQRPWLLLASVFAATVFFGFMVQAVGNVYLNWRADPIVSEYRTTLTYTSAVIGDG